MTAPDTGLGALRNVARALRARIEALDPTSLAWTMLWHADELQPWTGQAQACWERLPDEPGHSDDPLAAEDCWRLHHLAVLHHARAYDAENATPPRRAESLQHWEKALGCWARLHHCTTFWEALRQHVDEAAGKPVPHEVVEAVRERLPGDLLAVHTALAAEYRLDDPATAAAHMRLVTQSDLPADSIATARRSLVADLDNTTAQEINRVRFGPAFDYIVDWLTVDPTNPWLLRNLLYVTDGWARFINKQPGWIDQMAPLLERTERILQTARAKQGDLPAMLAGELARYEFWRGFQRLYGLPSDHTAAPPDELRSRLRTAEVAASHLRTALDLDPSVRLEYYYEGNMHLARALTARTELKLLLGWDLGEVEQDLTEAREYEHDLPEALELLARLRSIRPGSGIDDELPEDNAPEEGGADGNGADPTSATDLELDDGLSASDLNERGETYRLGKRHDEALAHFNGAIDLEPDYALAIARRGQTYLAMDRFDEALADLTRAIDLDPGTAWFVSRLGETYRCMNRFDEALTEHNRAIDLAPDNGAIMALRGETYRSMNRLDEALADYTRAVDLKPVHEWNVWAIARRGQLYHVMNRYDETLADLTRAINLDPDAAWIIAERGETYRDMNRHDEALADLTRAIELNPNYTWALARRGDTYRVLNRHDEALTDLTRAIDLNPNDATALAWRGQTYRDMNRLDEALADLTRAINLNPNDATTLAWRGDTHRRTNHRDEALDDLTRAIDLNPTYAWALASRGQTYKDMNRLDEALADLTRAIDLDPNYTWALTRRGGTHLAGVS